MNATIEGNAFVMIDQNELIERWVNVERVLVAMPKHERLKHWNMSTWGEVTDCGTIACAAGHCGLDPWFRDRGFALQFTGNHAAVPDVSTFFGLQGSSRIFYNSTARPVETVIDEVRTYIGELRQVSQWQGRPGVPRVGAEWPDQGGIFAGARLGSDGAPPYFLIVGPEFDGYLNWSEANTWAAQLSVGDVRDFTLPTCIEGAPLFDRVSTLFQPTAYWLKEQHAGGTFYAWGQDFGYGSQGYWSKVIKLRARAVRSVQI